jgi:hypothetical protein
LRRAASILSAVAILGAVVAAPVWAGPPFLTDDPEPVAAGHWEFYGASQWSIARRAASGTCPHLEVNYGAIPQLQLHAIVPAMLGWSSGSAAQYGVGDVELGAKFRFVDESERLPQVGTFPLVLLPTGSAKRGLGSGKLRAFLPIWVQKSFGPWTTYGGGGAAVASGERDIVAGWQLQRAFGGALLLGGEAFIDVPLSAGATVLRFNLGMVANLSAAHHLLLSAGPAFGDGAVAQAYAAYLLTI